MSRQFFIVVPSLLSAGPIKGAVALCNALADDFAVTLVTLKIFREDGLFIHPKVTMLPLWHIADFRQKKKVYRRVLREAGGVGSAVSISYCYSADMFNSGMKGDATIVSYVRGNLPRNYHFEYGWPGRIAAWWHLLRLHGFDHVFAVSESMSRQLKRFGLRRIHIVRNFLDEHHLEQFRRPSRPRSAEIRLAFLGSLTVRKRPDLLIDAVASLHSDGIACYLDVIGDGPMRKELENRVQSCRLESHVVFHGKQPFPYDLIQGAACMVLPSESEGTPRAVMEALFLGVPCIVRDVDANKELIADDSGGALFRADRDLDGVVRAFVTTKQQAQSSARPNLLPGVFSQEVNSNKILDILQ